jgi:hypothetical protein
MRSSVNAELSRQPSREQFGRRIDSGSSRHGEGGADDSHVIGGPGDDADALPVDRMAVSRCHAHDPDDVGDPPGLGEAWEAGR